MQFRFQQILRIWRNQNWQDWHFDLNPSVSCNRLFQVKFTELNKYVDPRSEEIDSTIHQFPRSEDYNSWTHWWQFSPAWTQILQIIEFFFFKKLLLVEFSQNLKRNWDEKWVCIVFNQTIIFFVRWISSKLINVGLALVLFFFINKILILKNKFNFKKMINNKQKKSWKAFRAPLNCS